MEMDHCWSRLHHFYSKAAIIIRMLRVRYEMVDRIRAVIRAFILNWCNSSVTEEQCN